MGHPNILESAPRLGRNGWLWLAAGGLDGEIEFVLGVVKSFLGLNGVAIHVVVIGSLGALHLVDGVDHMMVNGVEVVPVVDLGDGDSAGK